MGLHAINEQGNLAWRCPHVLEETDQPCGTSNEAHISHEAIQWHGHPLARPEHRTVSLPPCPACGAQTFLKVHFAEHELNAPNMWLPWNWFWEERLQVIQAILANAEEGTHKQVISAEISQLLAAKQAGGMHTPSHPMALRHMELAAQLIASGKTPPTP